MPGIGSEIKTFLKAQSGVTDLVGSGDAARIYPRNLKQNTLMPAIVYTVFAGISFESVNNGKSGLGQNRVQFDVYADDEDGANSLMTIVDNLLRPAGGFRGTMGATYVNGVNAEGTPEAGTDPPVKGGSGYRYWESRDYQVSYSEP